MGNKNNPSGHAESWTVNQWYSHPEAGNDDCNTGDDFPTLEAALASDLYRKAPYDVQYIEIDGPVGSAYYQVIKNPHYSARAVQFEENLDRQERAMQSGMAHGCQGYNEEMGYD